MIQHHACVLNQILFLSFYNLQFYITTTFIYPSSPFAFYYRIHPLPKTGKTWRLNFPAQFDGPFVGAVKSIGLIQRIPPVFASRRKKNEGWERVRRSAMEGRRTWQEWQGVGRTDSSRKRRRRRMSNSPSFTPSSFHSISLSLVRARLRPIRNHIKSVSMRPVKTPI